MIGQKLRGRYRLDKQLGAGAQGDVYLAFDEQINRQVAVKILKTASSDTATATETQLRVLQEAIATAKFEHVNVVRVFDFLITEEGVPFLVMEYLKGETVDRLQLPLEPDLLSLLVRQVCSALQNAHTHEDRLVHRDLKPGNLMLVDRGKPEQRFVILDLGLAKLTDSGNQHRFTHAGAGTPMYMSPEQIDGPSSGETVTFLSDIYSFGTMLFEMLTGTTPFASSSESLGMLLRAVCDKDPPALVDVYPQGHFPQELESLVRSCLEKVPARRPQSMQEVAEKYQAAMLNPAVTVRHYASVRRRPWIKIALALSILGGVGFYLQPTVSTWMSQQLPVLSGPAKDPAGNSPVTLPLPIPSKLVLARVPDQQIPEEEVVAANASLISPSVDSDHLLYTLAGEVPAGATLDKSGRFEWKPSEEQGPGKYPIKIKVQDINEPSRTAETSFLIEVGEVNKPPIVGQIPVQSVEPGHELSVAIQASDPDLPKNKLTFRLGADSPQGAMVDSESGAFAWTPDLDQGDRTYPVTVMVFDNSSENLAASTTFKVAVTAPPAKPGKQLTNSIGMTLVRIEPGQFLMGSPEGEKNAHPREWPQHRVRFETPFYMGIYEVTRAEYQQVTGQQPSDFGGPDAAQLPVTRVSWGEANEFCRLLSELAKEKAAGRRYRLPTEAEWEYACRAGSTTRFSYGEELSKAHVWFNPNSDPEQVIDDSLAPKPVGKPRQPNDWGLFDMHGNVWEWCADYHDDGYYKNSPEINPQGPSTGLGRVVRGGSFQLFDQKYFRSASRAQSDPEIPKVATGFRVVCDP